MAYSPAKGSKYTPFEKKACEDIQLDNPTIKVKQHTKIGKGEYEQDIDVFDLEGNLIGVIEVQTSETFMKFFNFQLFKRRIIKKYSVPCLIYIHDFDDYYAFLSQTKYSEIYNKYAGEFEKEVPRPDIAGTFEFRVDAPIKEFNEIFYKTDTKRKKIHNFFNKY